MKLHVRHTFPCDIETFWASYFDETLEAELEAASPMDREILEEREEDGVQIRRLRFTTRKPLPGMLRGVLGSDKLTYEQETRHALAGHRLTWRIIPPVQADRIKAEGTFEVTAAPGGCARVIDGVVEVRVPLVGGQIEKLIVNTVTEGYEKTAAVRLAWIRART